MTLLPGISAVVAIAALGLGACTTATPATHLHGPKSQPMKNSDMQPAAPCSVDGTHPMPGPRGATMSKDAHPGCQPAQSTGGE
jgi:hypothetical protein